MRYKFASMLSHMGTRDRGRSRTKDWFDFGGYRIPVRLCLLTGGGPETFEPISSAHVHNVNAACGLRKGLRVLEIGCGIGRDAIPLTDSLGPNGSYLGIDVIAESIEWCSENISARHPNFRFIHQDIRDDLHNPSGAFEVNTVRLPVEDGWADLIILQSVFTHMLRLTVSHYLHQFARVLSPKGLIYASLFLVDDETLDSARKTNLTQWNLRFEHAVEDGVYINDPNHPTGAVAYEKGVLEGLVAEAQLAFVGPVRRGSWSGVPTIPFDGQDVVVLRLADG